MNLKGRYSTLAHLIPKLMREFENEILNKYTPCNYSNLNEAAKAIAVVHVEYILIHPFREGINRNYEPMTKLFESIIKRSIKLYQKQK